MRSLPKRINLIKRKTKKRKIEKILKKTVKRIEKEKEKLGRALNNLENAKKEFEEAKELHDLMKKKLVGLTKEERIKKIKEINEKYDKKIKELKERIEIIRKQIKSQQTPQKTKKEEISQETITELYAEKIKKGTPTTNIKKIIKEIASLDKRIIKEMRNRSIEKIELLYKQGIISKKKRKELINKFNERYYKELKINEKRYNKLLQ